MADRKVTRGVLHWQGKRPEKDFASQKSTEIIAEGGRKEEVLAWGDQGSRMGSPCAYGVGGGNETAAEKG